MKNKSGQFYLVATIIIVGLVVALSVAINYSTRTSSQDTEEVAKTLSIESERVLDHDTYNSENEFEDFSMRFSEYAGEDKDIYFIIVNGQDIDDRKAYQYSGEDKVDLSGDLSVGNDVQFDLDGREYHFELEEGKNFYYVIAQDKGGERYVFTG